MYAVQCTLNFLPMPKHQKPSVVWTVPPHIMEHAERCERRLNLPMYSASTESLIVIMVITTQDHYVNVYWVSEMERPQSEVIDCSVSSILCNSTTLLYDKASHEGINYLCAWVGEMTSVHFWPLRQINVLPHFELTETHFLQYSWSTYSGNFTMFFGFQL